MTALLILQRDIAAAILTGATEAPARHVRSGGIAAAQRLGIHGNNTAITLTEALGATFPVTRRLVGDEFFAHMARAFIRQSPPRPGPLFDYGKTFAEFIAAFPPAGSLPYLPDVARLEWARNRAYFAADAEPLDPRSLAGLPEDALPGLTFRFHPSHRFVVSGYPIDRIWDANQPGAEDSEITLSGDANLLVLRRHRTVEHHAFTESAFAFLISLAMGQTVAVAARAAGTAAADVAEMMGRLLASGLFTGFNLKTEE